MHPTEVWLAGAILVALVIYALAGGADFGGGVWDLLARGPRAARQRDLIAHAIGPIWEANHVWLILAVVLLFACFPRAFAAIGTALHVPLALMLVGIVLRGSAFAFRSYGGEDRPMRRRWSVVFAVASAITPIMLGVTLGAVARGVLPLDPRTGLVRTDFVSAWLAPFPFAVGLLSLALFAYLAAVYLTMETDDPALQDDFRRHGVATWAVAAALAVITLLLARVNAPVIYDGLVRRPWSGALLAGTALVSLAALSALAAGRYAWARTLAATQVALILLGWGLAQYPHLVGPDLTVQNAAAPPRVLRAVLGALAAGAVLLLPALYYLFRLFKGGPPSPARESSV